jgi:hypothetical protein
LNELILAAAKDPGAVGELERQLDRALVFALGNRGGADLQARVLQVSDPVSQHTLIPLFSDESLVHALQSAVPEGRNLELLLVNPRGNPPYLRGLDPCRLESWNGDRVRSPSLIARSRNANRREVEWVNHFLAVLNSVAFATAQEQRHVFRRSS